MISNIAEIKELLSMVEILEYRSIHQPNEMAYTFLGDKEQSITYYDLHVRAKQIALRIQAHSEEGEKVLLLHQPGIEYICSFFGCLYSGSIAVPAYPPLSKRYAQRIQWILEDSGARVILTSSKLKERVHSVGSLDSLVCLCTDTSDIDVIEDILWEKPVCAGQSVAVIQYTSGSTGNPKGVMLSHDNLMHNSEVIKNSFGHSEESIGLVWLPPYHDMGLIGGILQPLYVGFPIYLMAPADFIQQPLRWLQYISDLRVTSSGGPNFAYHLALRKAKEEKLLEIDLSSWKVAFVGAEQVQANVMKDFQDFFSANGFCEESFYPCYGLAESTLFVTGGVPDKAPSMVHVNRQKLTLGEVEDVRENYSSETTLVSCGTSYADESLIIVDPKTCEPCEARKVGEIWVKSKSNALGYLNQPDLSDTTFRASINGMEDEQFLRTGDLGFLLNGELFITGRIKDLIIIRGQNFYPTDIEAVVENIDDMLIVGGGAAFSVDADGEQLVIVQELSRHARNTGTELLAKKIRESIASQFRIQTHAIVFIKQGSLGKTSSGKVMRNSCRQKYLQGELNIIQEYNIHEQNQLNGQIISDFCVLTSTELMQLNHSVKSEYFQKYLIYLLTTQMNIKSSYISSDASLISFGLDSLTAIDLQHRMESEYGLRVDPTLLLSDEYTLKNCADEIAALLSDSPKNVGNESIGTSLISKRRLSEDQQRLWFIHQINKGNSNLHIPAAIEVIGELNIIALKDALNKLIDRHPTLRTSLSIEEETVYQSFSDNISVDSVWKSIDMNENNTTENNIEQILQSALCTSFELIENPLFRFIVIREEEQKHILMFVFHHIIADLKSAMIALNDLMEIYSAPKTSNNFNHNLNYIDYLEWMENKISHERIGTQITYWQEQLRDAPPFLDLSTDFQRPVRQTYQGRQHFFKLSSAMGQRINAFSRNHGATPYMTLLTSFVQLMHLLSESEDIVIGSPVNKRNSTQLERAFGFYSQPIPLRIQGTVFIFQELLQEVRSKVLSAMSHQDISFSKIVEVVNPVRNAAYNPVFQVMFSYIKAEKRSLNESSLKFKMLPIEMNASDFDLFLTIIEDENGTLSGAFYYNTDLYEQTTIEMMSELFEKLLNYGIESPLCDLYEAGSLIAPILHRRKKKIMIASSFTSRLVEQSLDYWLQEIDHLTKVIFPADNQVFSQLLNPQSEWRKNESGFNVLLLRLSDLLSHNKLSISYDHSAILQLLENVDQFIMALEESVRNASVKCLLCICPESPEMIRLNEGLWGRIEDQLMSRTAHMKGLKLIKSSDTFAGFKLDRYYNVFADESSQVPYTDGYFNLLGTAIARGIYSIMHSPVKVIVLDCDNTLWAGVCGEDGVNGIQLDEKSLAIQKFIVEQHRKGILVCLCSKNNEEDVWKIFDEREEMLLMRHHITGYRINWQPKSENVRSLADELSLSVSSFVVFDDNPVECAEIESNCPEAYILNVGSEFEELYQLLDRVWIFDHEATTDEDLVRNRMYSENTERQQYLQKINHGSMSYYDFLTHLELEITYEPLKENQVARISQLTYRTNQFNINGTQYTEESLRKLMISKEQHCLTIHVKDRFGDYGLVGAVFYEELDSSLTITGWVLSCRVLGRGVENHILSHVAGMANDLHLKQLCVHCTQTSKNIPAQQFMKQIGEELIYEYNGNQQMYYQVSLLVASNAADLSITMGLTQENPQPKSVKSNTPKKNNSVNIHRKMTELPDAEALSNMIEHTLHSSTIWRIESPYLAPRDAIEQKVAEIWQELLNIDEVSIDDNFFFIGGNSLQSHQLIFRIRDAFQIDLPLAVVYSTEFSIAAISSVIKQQIIEQTESDEIEAIAQELEGLSDDEIFKLLEELGVE